MCRTVCVYLWFLHDIMLCSSQYRLHAELTDTLIAWNLHSVKCHGIEVFIATIDIMIRCKTQRITTIGKPLLSRDGPGEIWRCGFSHWHGWGYTRTEPRRNARAVLCKHARSRHRMCDTTQLWRHWAKIRRILSFNLWLILNLIETKY